MVDMGDRVPKAKNGSHGGSNALVSMWYAFVDGPSRRPSTIIPITAMAWTRKEVVLVERVVGLQKLCRIRMLSNTEPGNTEQTNKE